MTKDVVNAESNVVAGGGRGEAPIPRIWRAASTAASRPYVAAVGFALPVAAYFWFIHQYGVNVIVGDQLQDVELIHRSHVGTLTLGALWAPFGEDRTPVPRLVALLLSRTTHLNLFVEMYLEAALLFAGIGLLILAHKRRSPSTRWLYYCPVAILLLSFVQYANTLFGAAVTFYLVFVSLAAALFLLDRRTLNRTTMAAAIAVSVIGSFSSFKGLLIWPAGLMLLWLRRRPRRLVLLWLVASLAAWAAYFYHFNFSGFPHERFAFLLQHPTAVVTFFFTEIGDVAGQAIPQSGQIWVTLLGMVIFVVAVLSALRCVLNRSEDDGGAVGVALICFGLLFAALSAVGLAVLGESGAGGSRLTTFSLLLVVGAYLALLGARQRQGTSSRLHQRTPRVLWAALVPLMLLQVGLGIPNGLAGGQKTQRSDLYAADISVNIQMAPNRLVTSHLDVFMSAAAIRRLVSLARRYRLSLFDTDEVAVYARRGLDSSLSNDAGHS